MKLFVSSLIIALAVVIAIIPAFAEDTTTAPTTESAPAPAPEVKESVVWYTSLEEALTVAKEGNKDILINFTGSDWCIWCKRLHKEIFDVDLWKNEASKMYVLVEIDFPRYKKQSDEVRLYNRKLAERFDIEYFPTVFLMHSDETIYCKTGYQRGGAENYVQFLQEEYKKNAVKTTEATTEATPQSEE